jgi:putative FmdB family regulatory protein
VPSYEYKCDTCPLTLTIIRKITDTEAKPICANCAKEMTRVYDPPPITFEGKGWGKD